MNRIERLAHTCMELGNHVAEVVRMSNRMDAMLKDIDKDLSPQTETAILRDLAAMNGSFRVKRFRQLIANVNVAIEISSQLYNEEPVPEEPVPEEPVPEEPVPEEPVPEEPVPEEPVPEEPVPEETTHENDPAAAS